MKKLARTVLFLLAALFMANRAVAADAPTTIVLAIGEDEYHAKETLPEFAKAELEQKLHATVIVLQSDDKKNLPGLESLKKADLLVMFMRRRELPDAQLAMFKEYFDAGKPVVAIRTSCHAFQNWLEFDKQVLGCNYNNHYAAKNATLAVKAAPAAESSPLLTGVAREFTSASSLYKVLPLADGCTPLLIGTWTTKPPEPVAWTNMHKGGRVFFTSLGSPEDFKSADFRRLLTNGVIWALGDSPQKQ